MEKLIKIFILLVLSLSVQGQNYTIVVTQPAGNDTLLMDLLGVISGPLPPPSSPLPDITPQLQDIGVTSIRNNDNYDDKLDMELLFKCDTTSNNVPSWYCNPHNPDFLHFAASDTLFRAYINGGFKAFFRLGGESQSALPSQNHVFKGPQDTVAENNLIQAMIPVVEHYDTFEGLDNQLDYLDVWTEWPNGVFWQRSDEEFIWFFTKALDTLKHHFPNKKIGGPGFLVPTVFVIDGDIHNKATDLLASLYQYQVKPDFISWHLWSLNPMDYYMAGENYRKFLNGETPFEAAPWAGSGFFDDVEIICGAWGTPKLNVPDWEVYLLYNKQKGAAHLTADWIAMQETNTVQAFYYRGADPHSNPDTTLGDMGTSGLFYGDEYVTYKPKSFAFKLWSRIYNEFPQKLDCDFPVVAPDSSKLWVLPAKNNQNAFALLVSNMDSVSKLFTVDLSAVAATALDTIHFDIFCYYVNDNENGDTEYQNLSDTFFIAPQTVALIRILPKDYTGAEAESVFNRVKIYPNPAFKVITIENIAGYSIAMTDVSGKTVFSQLNCRKNKLNVDVSNFIKGVYFVKIYDNKNATNKKIIVY